MARPEAQGYLAPGFNGLIDRVDQFQALAALKPIDEMSSTTVLEPGQSVTMDAAGNLVLEIAA